MPLPGETDSHGALSEAVQLSVPPPEFATLNVLAAGEEPPSAPENDSDAGDTDSAGDTGAEQVTGLAISVCSSVEESARL